MTIVEIFVNIDCEGCERKIKKALKKLPGVDDVDIDKRMQKVTVMGWADQKKVLKTVRKTGKKAELWPYPYNPEYHGFVRHYCDSSSYEYNNNDDDDNDYRRRRRRSVSNYYSSNSKPSSSYNYYKHEYNNGDEFGYYQNSIGSTMVNEKTMSMFSDDNPHACAVM